MSHRRFSLAVIAGAALLAAAVGPASAQVRKIGSATNSAPSASTRAAMAAPNPAGLAPIFPAGVTSGSGAAVSRDPVAASTTTTTAAGTTVTPAATTTGGVTYLNNAGTQTATPAGAMPATTTANADAPGLTTQGMSSVDVTLSAVSGGGGTTVMGAPGYGVARGPAQTVPLGPSGYSAMDLARSFLNADGNHDGDLSRAEFSRLSIQPRTFEEMDRNFDGVVSRFEYDDGVR